MKGNAALDLYYLLRIQGYTVLIHFRLSAACLFHHKVMLRIFIRILQTDTVVLDNALPILVFIQPISVSLTSDSFPPSFTSHLSHFCCSQYPSSQRVMSVEVKFPSSDQVVGNEDAFSACPPAGDFDGDRPSRWAGRSPSLSLNRDTVRLHPVMRQQSRLAELKPSNHVSCSRYHLIFSPFCDCLNKLSLPVSACASKWLYYYLEAGIPPVCLFAGFATALK